MVVVKHLMINCAAILLRENIALDGIMMISALQYTNINRGVNVFHYTIDAATFKIA